MNIAPPTLTPESAAQLVNALPPQWHGVANLIIQGAIALILLGHYLASHGGLMGVKNAVLYGKKPPTT